MFYFTLRRFSVLKFDICVWTIFGPLFPFTFPSGKKGGDRGFFFWSRKCPFPVLRIFQNLSCNMFRNPVLKPGFPSLFQHGAPEGLRGRRVSVPVSPDYRDDEVYHVYRSVDLLVFLYYVVVGPIYAALVWAGSGRSNPYFISSCGPHRQDCLSEGPPSSSSSWWAVWTFPSPCGLSNGGCFWWFPAACRRRACTAAATAIYGGHTSAYPLPKVWGHCLGLPSFSSRAQDTDASSRVVLCASSSTVDLVRTGP